VHKNAQQKNIQAVAGLQSLWLQMYEQT